MYNVIDLFAGCGGLLDGFMQTKMYKDIASVEWLKPQVDTLINRLEKKWGIQDAKERVFHFDMQREEELFLGWENDKVFGNGKGLDYFAKMEKEIDVIIGGPPCQAYSLAGRVRDSNGMKNDYRNYLFEHYLKVVDRYRPKLFLFENVPGMLSATPDGQLIPELIRDGFRNINYDIIGDIKKFAQIDVSEYGVPQVRKRIILLGVNREYYKNTTEILNKFYSEILPKFKVANKVTVEEAIGDLSKFEPIFGDESHKKRVAYKYDKVNISWHKPRYHNVRDMKIFNLLADDLESGRCEYVSSSKLSELYEKEIGGKSQIHRYHVLRPNLPSTTIIAHLYKDGLRYIHYDPTQCRSITVREAARLQSFDDDFEFIGTQGNAYQMIGNAVPPKFAKILAQAVAIVLENN